MSKAALKDIAERAVRTFVAVFLTAVAAGWASVTDVATAKAVAWSGVIAAVTAVIGVIGSRIGDRDTASVL